jgi:phage head maturation protease
MLPLQRDVPIVAAELADEGRTVVIRALPLDTPTQVSDDGQHWYSEVWRAGAFDRLQPQKTVLQRNHVEANGSNLIGICRSITEADGHVVTEFEFLDGAPLAPVARQLLREGTWEGASVSVIMHRAGTRQLRDVVERTRVAQFRHLAIVDQPAYPQAKVLTVRHEPLDRRVYFDRIERARMLAAKRPG